MKFVRKYSAVRHYLTYIKLNQTGSDATWYLHFMVTQNMLRMYEGNNFFPEKKIRFSSALGRIKCV